MSNTLDLNKSTTNDSKLDKKIPNLKDFIKYLDQTLNMFDHYVSEEDYNNKDSDVHKLFVTLFNMYMDMENKKQQIPPEPSIKPMTQSKRETSDLPKNQVLDGININDIIDKHLASRKKQLINRPKWENIKHRTRVDSDKFVKEIYHKSLLDLKTTEHNSPIILNYHDTITNENTMKQLFDSYCIKNTSEHKNNKSQDSVGILPASGSSKHSISQDFEYNIYTENDNQILYSEPKSRKYEKTDDIDQKITKLKKMLNK